MLANAAEKVGSDLERANLLTTEDFIEYASINDENIHELYFSVMLYEGTESCLMCHQDTGEAVLEMGHFKWQGKTDNIAGLESGEPRQEPTAEQLLHCRPDQRRPLHAVPRRLRLRPQELRLHQPGQHRLPDLP